MALALGEAAAGLVAVAILLLLPGLVIVRASWPFVPFLSLSFWLLSWGFLPPAGPGRERFLHAALVLFGGLAALRLLKPLGLRRPSWPTLSVLGFAFVRLLPLSRWLAAPGQDAGFAASSALLLTWRDGIPASYHPLFPFAGFGLGDFGLSAVAADVSLLAGMSPPRALLLVTLASEGLLVLALFALARRYVPSSSAAALSLVAASLGLVAVAGREEEGAMALALALCIAGAALVLRGVGRSTSVAAGFFGGAALVAVGLPRVMILVVATVVALVMARADPRRLGLAASLGTLLASPTLWRLAAPLDLTEWRVPPLASALPVAMLLAAGWERIRRPYGRPWAQAGVIGAVVLAATLVDWRTRTTRVLVTADLMAAAGWLGEHSQPTDLVCSDDTAARAWLPALAGRRVHPPLVPACVQSFGGAGGACRLRVFQGESSDPEAGTTVLRRGEVSVTRLGPAGGTRGR